MKTLIDAPEPEREPHTNATYNISYGYLINTTMTVTGQPMTTLSVASGAAAANTVIYQWPNQ